MKRIALGTLAALALFVSTAKAGDMKFGAELGWSATTNMLQTDGANNKTKLYLNEDTESLAEALTEDSVSWLKTLNLIGFQGGGFFEYYFTENLGVGLNAAFRRTGSSVKVKLSTDVEGTRSYTFNYIHVPVLFMTRIGSFYMGVGPTANILLGGQFHSCGLDSSKLKPASPTDIADSMGKFGLGGHVSVGYEFDFGLRVKLDVGGGNFFQKIDKDKELAAFTIEDGKTAILHNAYAGLTLAYDFGQFITQ